MRKRVLSVGQCDHDELVLEKFLSEFFSVDIESAGRPDEAVERLHARSFDLVLVNRTLDVDQTDGIDLIRRIVSDARISAVPAMLITNSPQYESAAVAAGAVPGFGKGGYHKTETRDRLSAFLSCETETLSS